MMKRGETVQNGTGKRCTKQKPKHKISKKHNIINRFCACAKKQRWKTEKRGSRSSTLRSLLVFEEVCVCVIVWVKTDQRKKGTW